MAARVPAPYFCANLSVSLAASICSTPAHGWGMCAHVLPGGQAGAQQHHHHHPVPLRTCNHLLARLQQLPDQRNARHALSACAPQRVGGADCAQVRGARLGTLPALLHPSALPPQILAMCHGRTGPELRGTAQAPCSHPCTPRARTRPAAWREPRGMAPLAGGAAAPLVLRVWVCIKQSCPACEPATSPPTHPAPRPGPTSRAAREWAARA